MNWGILLAHPAVQALGRALLHFLWQGLLLALLLRLVKMITTPAVAGIRYRAASLILLLMPVTLVVTAWREMGVQPLPHSRGSEALQGTATSTDVYAAREAVLYAPTEGTLRAGIAGWVVCIWMAGVVALSTRAFGGWARAQRLRRYAEHATFELEEMMRRLQVRLRVSAPVRLCMSAMVEVPTVIGWLRPYILLPVTTITGLSDSQVTALVAHELAHVRRNDYLENLVQTAIETVLFYHPAVWWVGKQMRIEREHCCDDMAVRVCGNRVAYAEALARLEESRVRNPEPALAATGGELLGRIRRLLGQPENTSRSLGAITAGALVMLAALAPAIVALRAAPQEAELAFEVASIKRDITGQPGPVYNMLPPLFRVERATLKNLIRMAYWVHDFQILGGPGWIKADRYDIEAKTPGNPVLNQSSAGLNEGYRAMQLRRLQTLLHDRFKLAVHRETKEMPIYELTVAKGGPKLEPPNCIQRDLRDPIAPGKTMTDYCGFGGWSAGRYEATTGGMTDLAGGLSDLLERVVVDKTGITGMYHLHLTFTPDDSTIRLPDLPGSPPPPVDGPDIFTALQEQLGLKLESAKGPVEVLVIDHAEKPSEN
jgi:uncharacterized protein (TIGR03435 family)